MNVSNWVVAAIVSLGLMGCSGDRCARAPACINDNKPTETSIAMCHDNARTYEGTPCSGEFDHYDDCLFSSTVCNSSGHTDFFATLGKANTNCSQALDSYTACCKAQSKHSNACSF